MFRYRVPYAAKRRAHCLLARHCVSAVDLVLVAAHRQLAQLSRTKQPGVGDDHPIRWQEHRKQSSANR